MARRDRDFELWQQYKQDPKPENLQALIRQLDGSIQSQVNKWSGNLPRPYLEARAKALAVEAIDTYEPGRAALNTHVTNRLKKLSRDVYTHKDAVRVPEHKQLKINTFLKAQRELMSEHGREPTAQELQDHLGWSPALVSKVQAAMNSELLESEDVGGGLFERQSVWAPDNDDAIVDMFYYDLTPQDQQIFEHSTGYGGKPILSNAELTKKLGITQAQLSYRKRKLVDRLKEAIDE